MTINTTANSEIRAVVTGDTVRSTDLPPDVRRQLPNALHSAYNAVQKANPDILPYDLAIKGGDGWQWYIAAPQRALVPTLHFWTILYAQGISSRMALALDEIDFVSRKNLNESDGAAFRRSGRSLAEFEKEQRFECTFPEEMPETIKLSAEFFSELIDLFLNEWTEAQAQAVSAKLRTAHTDEEITQREIAEKWDPEPITRQGVNHHLKRAQWNRLYRTLDRFGRFFDSVFR